MTRTTHHRGAAGFALLVILAAGCGGAQPQRTSGSTHGSAAVGLAPVKSADGPTAAVPGPAGQGPGTGGGGAASLASNPAGALLPLVDARALVVTGTLEVRTKNAGNAAADTAAIVRTLGGFISEEDTSNQRATLTVRVRPDRYDEAVTRLAKLGSELHRSSSTTDVTDQVVDVASRLKTQQASVDRVRVLLDRATTLGDVVQIEGELSRREADLESLQARQRVLASQTDLATLIVTFTETDPALITAQRHRGFGTGLTQGWHAFTGAGAVLLTGLGETLPFAALVALAALAARVALRSRRRVVVPGADE